MRDIGAAIQLGNAINRDHPLNRGLVAHWLALPGLTGGLLFRDLCRRNDGLLKNGPLWSGAFSRPGGRGSLKFDGTNDHVLVADSPYFGGSGITNATWSQWVNPTSTSDKCFFMIGDYTDTATWTLATQFVSTNDVRTFVAASGNDAGNNYMNTATSPITLAWQHIVVVYDSSLANASRITHYRNGVVKASSVTGTIPTSLKDTTAGLYIGQFPNLGRYFSGLIDDVRYQTRSLSAGEIFDLYNESRMGYPTMLNRVSSLRTFMMGTAAAAGNRRRRVLLTGTS